MTTLNPSSTMPRSEGASVVWLLGDIGGTHSRLACWSPTAPLRDLRSFDNNQFSDFVQLAEQYLTERGGPRPTHAAFAVAGPVLDQRVQLTNRGWLFDARQLAAVLRCTEVRLLNDFTAIAWSLLQLGPDDLLAFGEGHIGTGPRGVLGPGTGLGVSALIPAAGGWTALVGEGGHVTLAASSREEDAVLEHLRQRFGHVSAERVLSGPGFGILYGALAEIRGLGPRVLTPEQVTARADSDPLAAEALQIYFGLLGSFSGDLALTLGASGGIYLAGGILPKLHSALLASEFRQRFAAKGRFRSYLQAIPTFLICREQPGLVGLTAFLSQSG